MGLKQGAVENMVKRFTIEEIKRAFWEIFHKSGELWFNYLGNDEENNDSTQSHWFLFYEELTGEEYPFEEDKT